MMRKLLSALSFLILTATLPLAAAVPASVSRAVKQAKSAPTLDVECTLNGRAASMSLCGNCFSFDIGNAQVYYNGSTQWSYSPADREVTILTPTEAELAETNPLLILHRLESDFNGKALKGNANTVRLTPKNSRNPIAEATITFNPTSGWPTKITIIMGGQRVDLDNLRFTIGKTKRPAEAFSFRPGKGVTITDLR